MSAENEGAQISRQEQPIGDQLAPPHYIDLVRRQHIRCGNMSRLHHRYLDPEICLYQMQVDLDKDIELLLSTPGKLCIHS